MPRFVATYNQSGVDKLAALGIRLYGRTLSFMEDDLTLARTFFRRYVRNFFGAKLHDADFSVYESKDGRPPEFGFLSKKGEEEVA